MDVSREFQQAYRHNLVLLLSLLCFEGTPEEIELKN